MRESAEHKPLPEITDLTRPFWAAALEGRLVMQKCARCATVNFFPKPWCIECGCRDLPWTEVRPTGTLYTFTVTTTVMMNLPGWKKDLPVVLALVDLDDGGRLYAHLTDCTPEDVRIGMRVQAYFAKISDEAGVPKFRPA